jgi:hypothetical protein
MNTICEKQYKISKEGVMKSGGGGVAAAMAAMASRRWRKTGGYENENIAAYRK